MMSYVACQLLTIQTSSMALNNTAKPSTSLNNTTKVSFAELWSTITTTWASETRTWLDTGSLFTNGSKPSTSLNNTPKP